MRIVSSEKVRGRKSVEIADIIVGTEDSELKAEAMAFHHEDHSSLFGTKVVRMSGSRAKVHLYTD